MQAEALGTLFKIPFEVQFHDGYVYRLLKEWGKLDMEITLHRTRHCFATWAAEKGLDDDKVARTMNHGAAIHKQR